MHGPTGLLYWRVDRWNADAWNSVNNTGVFAAGNYPGEGMLLYPGKDFGMGKQVVPSMRLKWLRMALRTTSISSCSNLHKGGQAAARFVERVSRNWAEWTRDPTALNMRTWTPCHWLSSRGCGKPALS